MLYTNALSRQCKYAQPATRYDYMTVYWKTRNMGFSVKVEFDNLYHTANPRSDFRPIACFAVQLQRFLCKRHTDYNREITV